MNTHFVRSIKSKRKQSGVVLVTALIFLIILLLLGTAVVNTTSTEEKMAQNARDSDIAFAAAEAALRDAELRITGAYQWPYNPVSASVFDDSCTNGWCDSRVTPPAVPIDTLDFFSSTGTGSNSVVIGTATGSPQVVSVSSAYQPKYLVELVCASALPGVSMIINGNQNNTSAGCSGAAAFRITAKGHGRLPNTVVTVQEVYRASNAPTN
jgi:type IV pilus assembly protein PilX